MFEVQYGSEKREQRIRGFLEQEPPAAVILAAVHFEWTLRRAIIGLGKNPNVAIREGLKGCHGLDRYKEVWKDELGAVVKKGLPAIAKDWQKLRKAFDLRNRLVHGVTSCTRDYAAERVEALLQEASNLRQLCGKHNLDLDNRLPIKKK